ncbi:MAG: trypsin-like peptidase domain-containing protein [Clostridia bacterium]|nr:trypsin-like peptidase domain-containing protein [Clostridia bacterium]
MNENENKDLFEEGNSENLYKDAFGSESYNADNADNETDIAPEPWQPDEFIPIKEVSEEIEDGAFTQAEPFETLQKAEQEFFQSAQSEEPAEKNDEKEPEFNPYAPKNNAYDNIGAGNTVNPSYGQPVNSQRPNMSGGYPTNYAYNNQGYYQTPQKNSGGGKKAAITIIVICVAVALIALVSSFFGGSEKPQTSTTTAPHSAIPTETTVPTTIPPVSTTTAAQNPSQEQSGTAVLQTTAPTTAQPTTQAVINSIWVAEKVRPSVVGVLAYMQGELAGEGSGVLMSESEDGEYTYVVTCAHVINEPGCEFAILLLDGSSYEAEIVALDERTDIGVLKVKATGLPLAEFGDSASLKVGEPIYAIGNPGGSEYFGSITNGIVAAIDRSISATYTMTCIQHNAAINPGNSGGALVNTAGQVIGINSSKIAKTDYEGMGFAVPSAIFASVVDSLIKYGYVPNRPELGIKYAAVSDYQLYSIIVSIKGLPKGSIVIAGIPEGSALTGTGAQVGDLIIAVNGKKMDSSDVLLDLIDTGAVGDTLTLTLCRINDRNYETSTFDVTVTLVENKGSATTTTQAPTLPQQDNFGGGFEDFFGDFFGW